MKNVPVSQIDPKLLLELLSKGFYPLSVTMSMNGQNMGTDLVYIEQEDGQLLGTTHIPEPSVLVHLYVTATKPIPKYPYGSIEHPGGMVGEVGPELIIPKIDKTKLPNSFSFELNLAGKSFHEALSRFNSPVITLNITPDMIETTLEPMDSNKVMECMNAWAEKEWFEYAAVAKKILDQRDQ